MKQTFLLWALLAGAAAWAQQAPHLSAGEKTAVVDAVAEQLQRHYVFPEKAAAMAQYIKKRNKSNAYAAIPGYRAFIDTVEKDLQRIHKDLHMSLQYNPGQAGRMLQGPGQAPPANLQEERRRAESKANYGFVKVELLPGNMGYLDFRQFSGVHEESENTVAAAMGFLAHADAVIIDLRNNGGGDPNMVQLILSYFMDEKPVHYNSIFDRTTNTTEDYYSLAKVKGRKMPHTDLYILTGSGTFSAAEEFTYNMKHLKRATIVGETTGGGAHPTRLVRINDAVVMAIPFARAINPFTKTNWEGTGVAPDVQVEARKALARAQQLAAEKALAKATHPAEKGRLEWQLQALRAELSPVTVSVNSKAAFAGTYGERKITLEGADLYYQRLDGPKRKMIPLSENLFGLEGLDYFRVRLVQNSAGTTDKLVGLYEDGRTDESPRATKSF